MTSVETCAQEKTRHYQVPYLETSAQEGKNVDAAFMAPLILLRLAKKEEKDANSSCQCCIIC